MKTIENWGTTKEILVILAHPDDPEFFLGGTLARWIKAGHRVRYVLLTKGDKGAKDPQLTACAIAKIRVEEQNKAARFLGVTSVDYLDYEDGYVTPDLELRKHVVRFIRQYRPHILVTCDPENLFPSQQYINHPDHRAAGQVVIDAVFPAAGNRFFFPELIAEGFEPHEVEEVWMSLTNEPDVCLDVTEHWDKKLQALKLHASQIGDPRAFEQRMLERVHNNTGEDFIVKEQFRRIIFRRTSE
ncbi:MAG: PIG-L family deacetylase [Chloroflexi bacterium]|nr:PIG-L family deacetylase [Chloroflexota bacterium]